MPAHGFDIPSAGGFAPAPAQPARGFDIPSAGGFAPATTAVPDLARSPTYSVPSGTVIVRSPHTMAVPVEFLVSGRLRDGVIADSVSAVAIEQTDAKIAQWVARAEANRAGSGRVWHQL